MITVTVTAACLRCDWTAGPGAWAAEKHTSLGHPTATKAEPQNG